MNDVYYGEQIIGIKFDKLMIEKYSQIHSAFIQFVSSCLFYQEDILYFIYFFKNK